MAVEKEGRKCLFRYTSSRRSARARSGPGASAPAPAAPVCWKHPRHHSGQSIPVSRAARATPSAPGRPESSLARLPARPLVPDDLARVCTLKPTFARLLLLLRRPKVSSRTRRLLYLPGGAPAPSPGLCNLFRPSTQSQCRQLESPRRRLVDSSSSTGTNSARRPRQGESGEWWWWKPSERECAVARVKVRGGGDPGSSDLGVAAGGVRVSGARGLLILSH